MDIFLFANFFPYKKAEPFLANEFLFTKKYARHITVFTLYGKSINSQIPIDNSVTLLRPLLEENGNKSAILLKGVLNTSGFGVHFEELFRNKVLFSARKLKWFITSWLITRMALSSRDFPELVKRIESSGEPLLYFYWGDNLCWLIPYLKKRIKNKKLRIVIRLHGSDLYEHLKGGYAPLRTQIFKASDLILPVSEFGKRYLQEKYAQFTNKIHLSRLGVFDHGLNPFEHGNTKVIVSVSNLVALKRVDKIFETLQKSGLKLEWHHFGEGPALDSLQDLVKHSRVGLKVRLHGHINNSQLMNFYCNNSVDIFLNLSTTEGLPVSIMEALSFGIPVMATNVGGTSELVSDHVGKLIDPDFNTAELSKDLDKLLSQDNTTISAIRGNARKVFLEKVWADKNYNELYNTLQLLFT